MRVILSLGAFAAVAEARDLVGQFEQFKNAFGRKYATAEEELSKFKNFLINADRAEFMNGMESGAKFTHRGSLGDWSVEEYNKRNNLQVTPEDIREHANNAQRIQVPRDLPSQFDWTAKGADVGVKDQGQCGSCWAFGTVASIEGANFLKTGNLISLSEQELVDCSSSDHGCNGGLPARAYMDLINNHSGMEREDAYPRYDARDHRCRAEPSKEEIFLSDWKQIAQDEDQIQAALVKYGPLAIALNADPFQYYGGGILDPSYCPASGIDHAVTLVGYGEENGQKYWKIKNSWGTGWGEDGYVRLIRGKRACGMDQIVTTAFIADKVEDTVFI